MVRALRAPTRPLPDTLDEHLWAWAPEDWMIRIVHRHPHRVALRARTFGPLGRFDPHRRDRHRQPREQPDGRGVLYVAEDLGCALAEALPEQDPDVAICPNRYALLVAPQTAVTLLDLSGDAVMQIGATAALTAGNEPRRLTQRWARAIYEDYPQFHGIRYHAAHQHGIALAVWQRAEPLHSAPSTSAHGQPLTGALLTRIIAALALQGRTAALIAAADCNDCRHAGLA